MAFQAYIDNIKAKTGLSASDFKKKAEAKGFLKDGKLKPETKATQILNWLKEDYGLARFPAKWNYFAEKESRQFNILEHVLVDEVMQLRRDMLLVTVTPWPCTRHSRENQIGRKSNR